MYWGIQNGGLMKISKSLRSPLLIALSFFMVNCAGSNSSETTSNPEQGPVNNFDVNQYALNKLICDPMGEDSPAPGPNDGLIATLYYRKQSQARFYDVMSYIDQGQESTQTLFFSEINVPTRVFSLGFPTETGDSVKNDGGDLLNEYFALKIQSVLKLGPEDEAGDYELALLSDDGAIMKIRDVEGVYQVVVDNDGDHPTKMGCGDVISMNNETELVVEIDYYQGPRYHISLIPMWRKVDASTQEEPLCGRKGNSLYFDYRNDSTPQQAYDDLLDRGWEPIDADNWHLPAFANYNPCTQGTAPKILSPSIENTEGFVTLRWRTDILAASQLLIENVATGEQTLTVSDNQLSFDHVITLTSADLEQGQDYIIQPVSISNDYGKTIGEGIALSY